MVIFRPIYAIITRMSNTIEIEEVLQVGWDRTKQHFGYLVGLVILLFVASMVLNVVSTAPVIGFILAIAGQVILNMGTVHITLSLANGQKRSYKELFTTVKPFWPFLGASLLVALIVGVGLVLLVVPGIVLGLTLQFYSYLIIDKHLGLVDSLKESARITKGHKWKLFWLMIILAIVNIIGVLIFGIGLLVSVPMSMMVMVHVYQRLVGTVSMSEAISEPPNSPKPLEEDTVTI